MSTNEDEPLSGLNGRLRPRKSNVPSLQTKSTKKFEGKAALDKPKKNNPSSKALPNKPDDLSNKADSLQVSQFLCPYCDKKFASKQTVSKHARRVHLSALKQDSFIACYFCNHNESETNSIIRHMVDSHPNQYFACLDCHTRFLSTSELAEHKLNVCEKQKPYRSKLRQKTLTGSKIERKSLRNNEYLTNKQYSEGHGFNGIVISCELKPSQILDNADIEDNITTNLILPPSKNMGGNPVIEKNAVIVLDDIQWNKRIPSNFSFHNTDADQILSRLGVVHRSPRTGESTKRDWFKTIDDSTQKFEKCFDTSFYSKVASNVQENLAKCLDGSFNFNPDVENTIKTRKSKNSVVINTAEGFPILLAFEQYSRNLFDSYMPRGIAPKHKWKWDSLESDKSLLINPQQIERDSHANDCIITLVSSLDIWTQLSMRRKYELKFRISHVEKKTEKQNIIDKELKEILESREIPTKSSHVVKYTEKPIIPQNSSEFPSYLGLMPSVPAYNMQPAILSGEWVRPRCYVCCACGAQTRDSRALSSHISIQHPNAQVQHYEIVGEPLLNADILKHLYVPPSQICNRTRPLRGFRDCTKCKKSVTLEELHQHMLDCAGDTPAVRRKCRYRPFGVRKRRRLPDNVLRRKLRKDLRNRHKQKDILRPRPKVKSEVGDAETIRKMIADLPAKRHRAVINPTNSSLRSLSKHDKQRSKLMMKRLNSEDPKSRRLRAIKELNFNSPMDPVSSKKNEHNNTSSPKDEDDIPLKPKKINSEKNKLHNETLKRKTVVNRTKRKMQMKKPSAGKSPVSQNDKNTSSQKKDSIDSDQSDVINVNNDQGNNGREHSGRGSKTNHGNERTYERGSESRNERGGESGNERGGESGNDRTNEHQNGSGSGRGNEGGSERTGGRGNESGNGRQNGNTNNNNNGGSGQNPPPPLKHSIASLTANTETHNKSVQFDQQFLFQQECNSLISIQNLPSAQTHQFENEEVESRLDKPPLTSKKKVPPEPFIFRADHRSKLNKSRMGLNDCIAMLKNKLEEPDIDLTSSGQISVQCGSDDPLDPNARFFLDPKPAEVFSRSSGFLLETAVETQKRNNQPPQISDGLHNLTIPSDQIMPILPISEGDSSNITASGTTLVESINIPSVVSQDEVPMKRKSTRLRSNVRRAAHHNSGKLPDQTQFMDQNDTRHNNLEATLNNSEYRTTTTNKMHENLTQNHSAPIVSATNNPVETSNLSAIELVQYNRKFDMSGGKIVEQNVLQSEKRSLIEQESLIASRPQDPRLSMHEQLSFQDQRPFSELRSGIEYIPLTDQITRAEQMSLAEQRGVSEVRSFLEPRLYPEAILLSGQMPYSEARSFSEQRGLPNPRIYPEPLSFDQISYAQQRLYAEQSSFLEPRLFNDQRIFTDQRYAEQRMYPVQRSLSDSRAYPDSTKGSGKKTEPRKLAEQRPLSNLRSSRAQKRKLEPEGRLSMENWQQNEQKLIKERKSKEAKLSTEQKSAHEVKMSQFQRYDQEHRQANDYNLTLEQAPIFGLHAMEGRRTSHDLQKGQERRRSRELKQLNIQTTTYDPRAPHELRSCFNQRSPRERVQDIRAQLEQRTFELRVKQQMALYEQQSLHDQMRLNEQQSGHENRTQCEQLSLYEQREQEKRFLQVQLSILQQRAQHENQVGLEDRQFQTQMEQKNQHDIRVLHENSLFRDPTCQIEQESAHEERDQKKRKPPQVQTVLQKTQMTRQDQTSPNEMCQSEKRARSEQLTFNEQTIQYEQLPVQYEKMVQKESKAAHEEEVRVSRAEESEHENLDHGSIPEQWYQKGKRPSDKNATLNEKFSQGQKSSDILVPRNELLPPSLGDSSELYDENKLIEERKSTTFPLQNRAILSSDEVNDQESFNKVLSEHSFRSKTISYNESSNSKIKGTELKTRHVEPIAQDQTLIHQENLHRLTHQKSMRYSENTLLQPNLAKNEVESKQELLRKISEKDFLKKNYIPDILPAHINAMGQINLPDSLATRSVEPLDLSGKITDSSKHENSGLVSNCSPQNTLPASKSIHQSSKSIHQSSKSIHQSSKSIHQSIKDLDLDVDDVVDLRVTTSMLVAHQKSIEDSKETTSQHENLENVPEKQCVDIASNDRPLNTVEIESKDVRNLNNKAGSDVKKNSAFNDTKTKLLTDSSEKVSVRDSLDNSNLEVGGTKADFAAIDLQEDEDNIVKDDKKIESDPQVSNSINLEKPDQLLEALPTKTIVLKDQIKDQNQNKTEEHCSKYQSQGNPTLNVPDIQIQTLTSSTKLTILDRPSLLETVSPILSTDTLISESMAQHPSEMLPGVTKSVSESPLLNIDVTSVASGKSKDTLPETSITTSKNNDSIIKQRVSDDNVSLGKNDTETCDSPVPIMETLEDPETARKIAMLPKELVEILGTMPEDHRKQLLEVLPQYVSTSAGSQAQNRNNTITSFSKSTESPNRQFSPHVSPSADMYMHSEKQTMSAINEYAPNYRLPLDASQSSAHYVDIRQPVHFLVAPPPPPPSQTLSPFSQPQPSMLTLAPPPPPPLKKASGQSIQRSSPPSSQYTHQQPPPPMQQSCLTQSHRMALQTRPPPPPPPLPLSLHQSSQLFQRPPPPPPMPPQSKDIFEPGHLPYQERPLLSQQFHISQQQHALEEQSSKSRQEVPGQRLQQPPLQQPPPPPPMSPQSKEIPNLAQLPRQERPQPPLQQQFHGAQREQRPTLQEHYSISRLGLGQKQPVFCQQSLLHQPPPPPPPSKETLESTHVTNQGTPPPVLQLQYNLTEQEPRPTLQEYFSRNLISGQRQQSLLQQPPLPPPLPTTSPPPFLDEDVKPFLITKMENFIEEEDPVVDEKPFSMDMFNLYRPGEHNYIIDEIIDLTEDETIPVPTIHLEILPDVNNAVNINPQDSANAASVITSTKQKAVNDKTASLRAVRIKTPLERNKSISVETQTLNKNEMQSVITSEAHAKIDIPTHSKMTEPEDRSTLLEVIESSDERDTQLLSQSAAVLATDLFPKNPSVTESVTEQVHDQDTGDVKTLEYSNISAIQQTAVNTHSTAVISPTIAIANTAAPDYLCVSNSIDKEIQLQKDMTSVDLLKANIIKGESSIAVKNSSNRNSNVVDKDFSKEYLDKSEGKPLNPFALQETTKAEKLTEHCTKVNSNATEIVYKHTEKVTLKLNEDSLEEDSEDDITLALIVKQRELKQSLTTHANSFHNVTSNEKHIQNIDTDRVEKIFPNNDLKTRDRPYANDDIFNTEDKSLIPDLNRRTKETRKKLVDIKNEKEENKKNIENTTSVLMYVKEKTDTDTSIIFDHLRNSNHKTLNLQLDSQTNMSKLDSSGARKSLDESESLKVDATINTTEAIATGVLLKSPNSYRKDLENKDKTLVYKDKLSIIQETETITEMQPLGDTHENSFNLTNPQDGESDSNIQNQIKNALGLGKSKMSVSSVETPAQELECSGVEYNQVASSRRSRRGKSMFTDMSAEHENIVLDEGPIESKTPLTKKQLIFSKLLLDGENLINPPAHSTPEKDADTLTSQNDIFTPENTPNNILTQTGKVKIALSIHQAKKAIKRKTLSQLKKKLKKSQLKKKLKKKKTCNGISSETIEHQMHLEHVKIQSESSDSLCYNSSLDKKLLPPTYIVVNSNKGAGTEITDEKERSIENSALMRSDFRLKNEQVDKEKSRNDANLTAVPEKRKNSTIVMLEYHDQNSKHKKIKLGMKPEDIEDKLIKSNERNKNIKKKKIGMSKRERTNLPSETRTTCYMPAAGRRTRSKSVIIKSSSADLYDPYDIDLDDMIETTEPFGRKQNVSDKRSSQNQRYVKNSFITKSLKKSNLSNAVNKVACYKDNEILSDSDDSSKSDVPLKKLAEEKERKKSTSRSLSIEKTNDKESKKSGTTLAGFDNVDKNKSSNETEEQLRSEQFMESFGFFSERKPRKSNLLASKKIAATFHVADRDKKYSSRQRTNKRSHQNENRKFVNTGPSRAHHRPAIRRNIKRGRVTKKKNFIKPVPCVCGICKKEFRRSDNYLRHQTTLLHISKLSEIEISSKTNPVQEEPNYLIIYKQQLDRLRILTKKFTKLKSKNPKSKSKFKLPTLDEILEEVKKTIREQQLLAERNLSRDEALFIDCCKLLKFKKPNLATAETIEMNTESKNNSCSTENPVKEFDLLEKPTKSDGDVDSITAKNILESEEVRILEKDLISGLKEAANASTLNSENSYQRNVSDVALHLSEDVSASRHSSTVSTAPDHNIMPSCEVVQKPNSTDLKKIPEVKEKMYPDIVEPIDIFEDKFDKIKRKCRSQAAAAKQKQTVIEPRISHKVRRKSEKKKHKKTLRKNILSSQVLTKGALKGFEGIKVSIPTSDLNISAIVASKEITPKKKKRNSSKKKKDKKEPSIPVQYVMCVNEPHNGDKENLNGPKKLDVYEFMDNEDAELFEFRPSTLNERFKGMTNKEMPSTSKCNPVIDEAENIESASDGDDFVYMSDDYVCSDNETENSIVSCEMSSSKIGIDAKKSTSPLKRKDAVEKNAVMGKIFKNNALRADKISVKGKEPAKPKANLDQLFDSLLEEEQNVSNLNNDVMSPIKNDFTAPNNHELPSNYDKHNQRKHSSKDGSPSAKRFLISSPRDYDSSTHIDYGPSTSKQCHELLSPTTEFGLGTSRKRDIASKDFKDISPKKYDSTLSKRRETICNSTSKHTDTSFAKDETFHKGRESKNKSLKEKSQCSIFDEGISTSYDFTADVYDHITDDDMGVARQRARRKCTVGKQNVLAETWSSESEPDSLPPRPTSAESVVPSSVRRKKGKKRDTAHSSSRRSNYRHVTFKKQHTESRAKNRNGRSSSAGGSRVDDDSQEATECNASPYDEPVPSTSYSLLLPPTPRIRPRPISYYLSSEGDDEQEHMQQHGWIVGDSHKKLVTMLAHAKGRNRHDDKSKLID